MLLSFVYFFTFVYCTFSISHTFCQSHTFLHLNNFSHSYIFLHLHIPFCHLYIFLYSYTFSHLHTFLLSHSFCHSYTFLLSYTYSCFSHLAPSSCKLLRLNSGAQGEHLAWRKGCLKCGGVVRLWVHGICHCRLICGGVLKSFEGLKTWGWSRQWEILVVIRLGLTRAEILGIVQWVTIVPCEAVCGAKDDVVRGKVCYIVTHPMCYIDVNIRQF